MTRIQLVTLITSGFALAACASSGSSYEPVADGPTDVTYAADLEACQAVATDRSYINGDTRNNAMIGAGLGMLAGIADDDVNDTEVAIAGAIVGAVAGAGATMVETRDERRDIVIDCMKGRGHPVVG